jgi:cbb3-type cytochrome oxidase maturation protein
MRLDRNTWEIGYNNTMLWTILALIVLMFFLGLAAWFTFIWAVKTGQFDDIERPKHRMLDDDS